MRVLLLCLSIFLISRANAQEKAFNIENIFKVNKSKRANSNMSLGYKTRVTNILHDERSSNTDFKSLGEISKIYLHSLDLTYNREFYSAQYISYSLILRAGFHTGRDDGSDEKVLTPFYEKASGLQAGAGISINLNTRGYGLKFQPYISSQYVVDETNFDLTYEQGKGTQTTPVHLTTNSNNTILHHSIGVRVLDYKKGLMSYIAIGHNQLLSNKSSSSGELSGKSFDLDNSSKIKDSPIVFSLGFGFMF